jgi:hypothetical protein
MDSRTGPNAGRFYAQTKRTIQVTGYVNVPTGAVAVTGNLTVTGQQTAPGYVTVAPSLKPNVAPDTSTVNFPVGDIRANGVTVALSSSGTLDLMYWAALKSDWTNIVLDITGFFGNDYLGSTYHPITPGRVMDSRTGPNAGWFYAQNKRGIPVAGYAGVPWDAKAVTGNVTVCQQTAPGYVTVAPSLSSYVPPGTSTVNFPVGDVRANGVTVALSSAGSLDFIYWAQAGAQANIVFDVTGYFTADSRGYTYHPITPVRAVDSRIPLGTTSLVSRFKQDWQNAGLGGAPSNGVAVTANVTVVNQTAAGYVTVAPSPTLTSGTPPSTSTVNFPVGDIRANGCTVTLGTNGRLDVMYWAASTSYSTDLIVDITGYYGPNIVT